MSDVVLRNYLVMEALESLPNVAREAVLARPGFKEQWDLPVALVVRLGDDGPSFRQDRLYQAIRAAIEAPDGASQVADQQDHNWYIQTDRLKDGSRAFSLSNGEQRLYIDDYSALARDEADRLSWFERTAATLHLLPPWESQRRDQLREGPLSDDAYAELLEDIEASPASVDQALRRGLRKSYVAPRWLVPASRRYYERLIGKPTPDMTATVYLDNVVGPMVYQLVKCHGAEGLRLALLCCSHARVSNYLPLQLVGREELLEVFAWLATEGDPISRMGGVEAGLRSLTDFPELESYIEATVKALLKQNEREADPYVAVSAIFSFSVGYLVRQRILSAVPPFYLRQAAFSQASLIMRALSDILSELTPFLAWVERNSHRDCFYLQALIDLRREPKWLPEYAQPMQLRAEVAGRLAIASARHGEMITHESLRALLVGPNSVLQTALHSPYPYLPGPLEGASEVAVPLPDQLIKQIRSELSAPHLDDASFITAIEAAIATGNAKEVADLAFDALTRVNYIVETDEAVASSLFGTLKGLALLAAMARASNLAEAVRLLTRIKRRLGVFVSDPENEVCIALTTAAAFENIDMWSSFAGEWITEIASGVDSRERAESLRRMILRLIHLEPVLLPHLARAEATLSSFIAQQ